MDKDLLLLRYKTALEKISERNVSGYDDFEEVIDELQEIATQALEIDNA